MTAAIDEICPGYVGEARIRLTLSDDTLSPAAFGAVDIDIDYSSADPEGIVLPLELTITAPSSANFVRKVFRRTAPTQFSFKPREGGRYLVRIAEVGHNRWYGVLRIDVAGESTSLDQVTR